jgi:hypothetical protein
METYETYRYIHAKSSWMSAREALQMVEKLAEMGAEDGNIDSYMRQGVYNDYLRERGEPEFGTSDFIATVPMMYQLANGVELTLKGYTYATNPGEAPRGPLKLAAMLESFRKDAGDGQEDESEAGETGEAEAEAEAEDAMVDDVVVDDTAVGDTAVGGGSDSSIDADDAVKTIRSFIRAYTEDERLPKLFADFLQANEMTMNDIYGARRFLNNTSFNQVIDRYQPYLYTWDDGKTFYQEVLRDVRCILPILDGLQANIDSEGIPGDTVKALRRPGA